jgi:hypothetical protein
MADQTTARVQLPPAGVDFNKLHDALADGKSPEDARDAALIESTVALSADEAAQRSAESIAEAPSLAKIDKTALIDAGELESVTHARNAEGVVIPFAEATNAQMRQAIEAMRAGSPILPDVDPDA